MNNIVKYILLLVFSTTLLVACKKNEDLVPAEYHSVVLIKENATQEVTLYTGVGEEGRFEFTILKSGSEPNAVATVEVELISGERLKSLGFNATKQLPSNLYTIDKTTFNLDGNNRYAKGTIILKNDEIANFLQTLPTEERSNYRIALQIKSNNATVNLDKNYFILRPIFLKPEITYEVAQKEVIVGSEGLTVDFFLTLPFNSPWDFECTVATATGITLPSAAFTLGNSGKVLFKKGNKRSEPLHIQLKGDLVGKYTLPLKIITSTKSGIKLPSNSFIINALCNKIPLTSAMLSTNAQEPTEGAIANLLDNNLATFFHSAWSVSIAETHHIKVSLNAEKRRFVFTYNNRQHTNGKAKVIKILGSENGTNWFEITTINSGLPTDNGGEYTSAVIESPQPFKSLRFDVEQTQGGTKYFCMSEFAIFAK